MKTSTIRFIDLWLGAAACAVLSGFDKVRRACGLAPDPMAQPPRRILYLKLVEQGATVLACGALRRGIDLAGRDNVYFCCFEENRPIADILDMLPPANILAIRTDSFLVCVWDILRVILHARRLGVDATVDLEFFAKSSAVLAYLCGARRRVGMDRFTAEGPYRGNLMTHRMQYSPYVHTSVTYTLLAEALTRSPGEVPLCKVDPAVWNIERPRFAPRADEVAELNQLLGEVLARREGRMVLLNPNPSDLLMLRKWPAPRFIELARRLLTAHPDLSIVIIGTPGERADTEALCKEIASDRVATLAGRTTMRQLLTLFTLADVLVTNDSGPAHFAAMTNIEIVAMYGPETPLLFGPLGPHVHVLHHAIACSPCLNVFNHRVSPCRDNVCIQLIAVEEAADCVEAALAVRAH